MDYDTWKMTDPYADCVPDDDYIHWDDLEDVRGSIQSIIYMLGGEDEFHADDLFQHLEFVAQELNLYPPAHPLAVKAKPEIEVQYEIKRS